MGGLERGLACGYPVLSHTAARRSRNPSSHSAGQPDYSETVHSPGDQPPKHAAAPPTNAARRLSLHFNTMKEIYVTNQ